MALIMIMTLSGCTSSDIGLPKVKNEDSVLYISHLKENAITALDLSTGSEEKVSLPIRFSAIVEIKSGVYVASVKEEEDLYVINTNENKVSPYMEIDAGILELTYDQKNGLLYTSNGKKNQIQVIDVEKKEIIDEVSVGDYPSKMVHQGQRLYVLAAGSGEVYVMDTSTHKITNFFSVNERPEGLHSDGKYIWTGGHGASGEMNENVFAYDPETGKEVKSVATGLMPIQITQVNENSSIYVLSHGDHSLTKFNEDTYEVEKKITVGDNPSYMIADGTNLYVSSLDGDEILVLDQDSLDVVNKYAITNGPYLLFKGGEGE
jgi:DNA-binding beta-propeller fold protein YncE